MYNKAARFERAPQLVYIIILNVCRLSVCLSVSVCVLPFFSATTGPFVLEFGMVIDNTV